MSVSVNSRDTAEHYVWGNGCDGWRLVTQPDLSVIEERMPSGASEVARGDSLEVPPQIVHRVYNPFPDDVRFLVVSTPTTAGDRINV
jgi:hypothetical protein